MIYIFTVIYAQKHLNGKLEFFLYKDLYWLVYI